MYPVLRPFLGRGGAGNYITREESVVRVTPFVERHHRLLHAYADTLGRLGDAASKARLDALMPYARTEAAKLAETVISLGGTPSRGARTEPGDRDADATDATMLHRLLEREQAYHDDLLAEVDAVHHQERTRSILQAVARGSAGRMDALREVTTRLPRPV